MWSGGGVDRDCCRSESANERSVADTEPYSIDNAGVDTEPRLAARVLQTANSAAFNSTGNGVAELRTAIRRLGQLKTVR